MFKKIESASFSCSVLVFVLFIFASLVVTLTTFSINNLILFKTLFILLVSVCCIVLYKIILIDFKIEKLFILALGCFCMICLAPPTDADSLDYHLGFAKRYLSGDPLPYIDWLHSRLVGVGEYLNVLALSSGLENLGAILQFIGLIMILKLIRDFFMGAEDKKWVSFLVLSMPVLLFMVPNQKFQLLPIAALLTSVCLALEIKENNFLKMFLALSCIAFAILSKTSFLLEGALVFLFVCWQYYIKRVFKFNFFFSIFLVLVLSFPLLYQRFIFWGDCFSPFFEKYKAQPDLCVLGFVEFLKNYRENSEIPSFLNLFVVRNPGGITNIIGIPAISFILFLKYFKKNSLSILALVIFIAELLVFNSNARFCILAFLLVILSIDWGNIPTRFSVIFKYLVILQFSLMFIPLSYAIYSSTGAIVSNKAKQGYQVQAASDYAASLWCNEVLPKNAVIWWGLRSNYFAPRSFIANDYLKRVDWSTKEGLESAKKVLNLKKLDYIVVSGELNKHLKYCVDLVEEKQFHTGVRNPLNKSTYLVGIYKVKNDFNSCLFRKLEPNQ